MVKKGHVLYKKAKKIIPGGTQILSKRPEMFLPDNWPSYYQRAKGVYVWDLDGNRYIDATHNGLGASILGYADEDVNKAVSEANDLGAITTLNCPEEVELAELLIHYHPWSEMVRYARTGGEAVAVAIRIARASTKKDLMLFCGYHGWHDWYLSSNLSNDKALDGQLLPGLTPHGVPRGLIDTAIPFEYNNLKSLKDLINKYKGEIAGIIMEPTRNIGPMDGFLENVRELATFNDIVLIFDEVTSGFRMCPGGIHKIYGVNPDIAVFAKAIANGFPMAAIIGTSKVMSAAQDTFISSAFWSEKLGPVAALKTIKKCVKNEVYSHITDIGKEIQNIWRNNSEKFALDVNITGLPPLSVFAFKGDDALEKHTLFTQEMLNHGFLASNSFYVLWKHDSEIIKQYASAVENVFEKISSASKSNKINSFLKSPVRHSGFKRLT